MKLKQKNGRSREVKEQRQAEAKARQDAYSKLTVQEKIAKLDAKLGVGVGAVKQRKRLAAALAKTT